MYNISVLCVNINVSLYCCISVNVPGPQLCPVQLSAVQLWAYRKTTSKMAYIINTNKIKYLHFCPSLNIKIQESTFYL